MSADFSMYRGTRVGHPREPLSVSSHRGRVPQRDYLTRKLGRQRMNPYAIQCTVHRVFDDFVRPRGDSGQTLFGDRELRAAVLQSAAAEGWLAGQATVRRGERWRDRRALRD